MYKQEAMYNRQHRSSMYISDKAAANRPCDCCVGQLAYISAAESFGVS